MSFWTCNIDRKGRRIRLAGAIVLLIASAVCFATPASNLLAAILGVTGLLTLFEALRGWCVLRACKIKTPW